jgi:Flavin reductase like domain
VFRDARHWAVHVLAADQGALSDRFARSGSDKFAGLAFADNGHGVPLLAGCAARFECRASFQYDGGDHLIFVGEVTAFEHAECIAIASKPGRLRPSSLANATGCSSNFLAFDCCCSARLLGMQRMPGSSALTGALKSLPNHDNSVVSKLPCSFLADRNPSSRGSRLA